MILKYFNSSIDHINAAIILLLYGIYEKLSLVSVLVYNKTNDKNLGSVFSV